MYYMKCPRCGKALVQDTYEGKTCHRCPNGHGTAMSLSGLRALCGSPEFANALLQKASERKAVEGLAACPFCGRPMTLVTIKVLGRNLLLDVCRSCQAVWFDPSELEAFPHYVPQSNVDPTKRANEIIALHQVRRIREEGPSGDDESPDSPLKWVVAFLGFPVEQDAPVVESLPLLTWFLATICFLGFWLTHGHVDAAAQEWGLIPAEPLRHHGATFLTSMFLHGGFPHLIGNLYFLLIFGDNVEDALGKVFYLFFVLCAGLAASLGHILFNLGSTIPCIGASGFISGVIAVYAVLFPQVRISILYRTFFYRYRWWAIPAWGAFLLWFVGQGFMAWLTADALGGGGVAYLAHLGGALFGLAVGFLMRWRLRQKAAAF